MIKIDIDSDLSENAGLSPELVLQLGPMLLHIFVSEQILCLSSYISSLLGKHYKRHEELKE